MEIATIREAVAVFDEPARLEDAMSDLQSNGVDRADLGILVPPSVDPEAQLGAAQQAVVSDTDLRQGRVLGTSLAATIAGFAAAGVTVATGGAVALVAVATAAAAGGAALTSAMIGRQVSEGYEQFIDTQLVAGGALLLVRVRDAKAEITVPKILRRHSKRVEVYNIPAGALPAPARA